MGETHSRRSSRSLCRRARGPICLLERTGEVVLGLIAAGRERKEEGKREGKNVLIIVQNKAGWPA